jgi:hypothetical protein
MDALKLIAAQLAYGEVDGDDDLPVELDDLIALHDELIRVAAATRVVRQTCDAQIGKLLPQGAKHDYGDFVVSHGYTYKWKPIISAAAPFVTAVVEANAGAVHELFSLSSLKKTGVEKAARHLHVDAQAAVNTVFEKVWDAAPRVKMVPKEVAK